MLHYRTLLALAILFNPPLIRADEVKVRATALSLPAKLSQLMEDNKARFAGSTFEMVEAAHAIASGLMPSLIVLLADDKTAEEQKEIQAGIERDAQGIAAGVHYGNHALGWGGTITRIEASFAYCEYIEVRVSHAVTQQFENDETFEIERWREQWSEAGGNLGGGAAYEEAQLADKSAPATVSIEQGELRFARGKSGGTYHDDTGVLTKAPIRFGARAGQRLLLASMDLSFRVEAFNPDGAVTAVTPWSRVCDVELPESKRATYQIIFRQLPEPTGNPAQILVEIR